MSTVDDLAPVVVHDSGSESRRERLRLVLRSKTFLAGAVILVVLDLLRALRAGASCRRPVRRRHPEQAPAAVVRPLVRHRPARPRRLLAGHRRGARHPRSWRRWPRCSGTVLGTALGLVTGYFRGLTDDVIMRIVDAFLAIPVVIIGLLALTALGPFAPDRHPRHRRSSSRRSSRAPSAPPCFPSASSTTSRPRASGTSAGSYILGGEILPNVLGPVLVEFTVRRRFRDLRHRHPVVPRVRHPAAGAGLGAPDLRELRAACRRRLVADVLPGARHRHPRRRSQPRRRRPDPGVRAMSAAPVAAGAPALELDDLGVAFSVRGRWLQVLRGVSLTIAPGESYGLVGESGCGKSTTALTVMRYLPRNGRVTGGAVRVGGADLLALSEREVRRYRARTASMVYQNPGAALNPIAPRRRPGRRGVHRGRPARRGGPRPRPRAPRPRPDRRPGERDAPLPPPALRRDAAARAHRDGARLATRPSSSWTSRRRASTRPWRRRCSTSSRACARSWARAFSSSATTSQSCGGCATGWACCTPGGWSRRARPTSCSATRVTRTRSGCCAACREAESGKDERRLDTIPGLLPTLGADLPGCVFADRCGLVREICREEEPPLHPVDPGAGEPLPLLAGRARAPRTPGRGGPLAPRSRAALGRRLWRSPTRQRRSARTATTSEPSPASPSLSAPARRSAWSASPGAGRPRSPASCSASRRPTPAT